MRQLLPDPVPDPDVHAVYARGWVDAGGVRANFVASVDGSIAVEGQSAGLQTPGDNRVFAALRDLADVVLVGAGTAQAEKYGPVVPAGARAEARARFGMSPQLSIALVSGGLNIDPDGPLFQPTPGAPRPILITRAGAPADRLAVLAERADIITAGDDSVDLDLARAGLEERGMRRILCEGGPSLFTNLLQAGVADELCLTVSPLLAGGNSGRITGAAVLAASGSPTSSPQLRIEHVLEEAGALFLRYRIT